MDNFNKNDQKYNKYNKNVPKSTMHPRTSMYNKEEPHNNFCHHISTDLLNNQIPVNILQLALKIRIRILKILNHIMNGSMKRIPSLPTVAKYTPSVEKATLLIDPWQICHLAIGLLCQEVNE